jgi:phospholipid-translocating ATPase
MNSRQAHQKTCLFDTEVNFLSKLLFGLLVFISFAICTASGFHGNWLIYFFRVVLLMSSIIPISLRVNLDIAKLWYMHCINTDNDIKGAIARNSNVPEDLGRLEFLITDKTGTLTQNDMICKKLCIESTGFSLDENQSEMIGLLRKSCNE